MTTIIERRMPSYRLRQVDRVAVAVDPDDAYKAARGVDLAQLGIAKLLFGLRTFPDRVIARLRGRPLPAQRTSHIEDFAGAGRDWLILGEDPGREVSVGAVGKFWLPRIEWARTTPGDFAGFGQPGYGKLAWSIRVDPRDEGGSWIAFELRVTATDDGAWQKFQPYWRLIGPFSHLLRRALLGELRRRLGAPDVHQALPGDELLHDVRYQRTHTRVIEAPPSRVWPWLVQMGCRRAGWYAIDRLDNAGQKSADRVIDELQHINAGDILPATPDGSAGFAVLRVDPPRALVLGSPDLSPGLKEPPWPFKMTWSFVLEPIDGDATNLIVRVRGEAPHLLRIAHQVLPRVVLHEVMERAQLRNLKERVEAVV